VTGSDRAFAAGADIKEMTDRTYPDMFHDDFLAGWHAFAAMRTPKIAAVAGYALGGGCELAMMCDIIYAADTARFGQPEIKLGTIPGMGGTQRLVRAIGKAKAMEMILTGRMMGAREAEAAGLVARVVTADTLFEDALAAATTIAGFGKMATMAAREAVDQAFEMGLTEGVRFERRLYHSLWATTDLSEGMRAFADKRPPTFTGR
jgi:enoyl-CoA hydratase